MVHVHPKAEVAFWFLKSQGTWWNLLHKSPSWASEARLGNHLLVSFQPTVLMAMAMALLWAPELHRTSSADKHVLVSDYQKALGKEQYLKSVIETPPWDSSVNVREEKPFPQCGNRHHCVEIGALLRRKATQVICLRD